VSGGCKCRSSPLSNKLTAIPQLDLKVHVEAGQLGNRGVKGRKGEEAKQRKGQGTAENTPPPAGSKFLVMALASFVRVSLAACYYGCSCSG